MAMAILQRFSTHSFGAFFNNMKGRDERSMYPHCRFGGADGGEYLADERERMCVQSHYLYSIVIDSNATSVVSRSFFDALRAGAKLESSFGFHTKIQT